MILTGNLFLDIDITRVSCNVADVKSLNTTSLCSLHSCHGFPTTLYLYFVDSYKFEWREMVLENGNISIEQLGYVPKQHRINDMIKNNDISFRLTSRNR